MTRRVSRYDERKGLTVENRLRFLENDSDNFEATLEEHAEDDARAFQEVKGQNRWIFVAIIMTLLEVLTVAIAALLATR